MGRTSLPSSVARSTAGTGARGPKSATVLFVLAAAANAVFAFVANMSDVHDADSQSDGDLYDSTTLEYVWGFPIDQAPVPT